MIKLLWLIGALCQISTGLGMLGLISGFSNTDSSFSKILGAAFLIGGIATLQLRVFEKRP